MLYVFIVSLAFLLSIFCFWMLILFYDSFNDCWFSIDVGILKSWTIWQIDSILIFIRIYAQQCLAAHFHVLLVLKLLASFYIIYGADDRSWCLWWRLCSFNRLQIGTCPSLGGEDDGLRERRRMARHLRYLGSTCWVLRGRLRSSSRSVNLWWKGCLSFSRKIRIYLCMIVLPHMYLFR